MNEKMRINKKTALSLLRNSDLLELGRIADGIRKDLHPDGIVTFIVDRNINYTNVCINKCRFCAFYRDPDSPEAYILNEEQLFEKIRETIHQGGTQILIQGGLHPALDLSFYTEMLKSIKREFNINVHGFSPPEISYIAGKSGLTLRETLLTLKDAGLDSIPGGGAEILSDRVRAVLSPKKIRSSEWLEVMEEAHGIGIKSTATMMFGSIEGEEDIIEHLDAIRALQDRTGGFTAFIPWTFQPGNTELASQKSEVRSQKSAKNPQLATRNSETRNPQLIPATAVDYLRVLSLSRLYLDNIRNIQASWVTQGLKMAQAALRFGANDFGSTMIEENVVKAAGVSYRVTCEDIINSIRQAGFRPAQRNTRYNIIKYF
ncbi:Cyclic dehypoxanthine futalosine synthase [hydrothermal vent metagenome]|uniref:Cyclic dehypoxanthine futalosine synthase n=1 Tax=hydrothermal vent metagenome TaxID=652676 RepID=A0A3B1D8A6_9ZZZZ